MKAFNIFDRSNLHIKPANYSPDSSSSCANLKCLTSPTTFDSLKEESGVNNCFYRDSRDNS